MIRWHRYREEHASLHDDRDLDAFLKTIASDVASTPTTPPPTTRGLSRWRTRVSMGLSLWGMVVVACLVVSIMYVRGDI